MAVQPARWFLLALQFVGPKPCKSFFVLTKHVNAVSLKLHWTACWNLEENAASAIDFEWEFYSPNKNIYEQCICCVSQLFNRRFNPGTLRIARSAVRTLRSVRKQTRVRFLNSCPERGSLTILYIYHNFRVQISSRFWTRCGNLRWLHFAILLIFSFTNSLDIY